MKKVFVGLSGGVDSAVVAAMLKKRGYAVTGVFLREYDLSLSDALRDAIACSQDADRASAVSAAAVLNIPFEEWDFRDVYAREVVEYMVAEYAAGRTPNPDVMCNKHVKFGVFLEEAIKRGADAIATGHYVRKVGSKKVDVKDFESATYNLSPITYHLRIAKDTNKDQSYFLYTLTQAQLARCLFPLGTMTKPHVRVYAKSVGLPNWNRKDSQGVCFVGKIPMKEFLKEKIPVYKGELVLPTGRVVGEHDGAAYLTIGQRHGCGVPGGGQPLYVVEKDMQRNRVMVALGQAEQLYRKDLWCTNVHWIKGTVPALPLLCKARIRYRQPLQSCTIMKPITYHLKPITYRVIFHSPQRAVTPGQAIVFYRGTEMLGGGIIQ